MNVTSSALLESLHLRSQTVGRERWDLGQFVELLSRGQTVDIKGILKKIEQATRSCSGVCSITVNPLTLRALVVFDPQVFTVRLNTFWSGLFVAPSDNTEITQHKALSRNPLTRFFRRRDSDSPWQLLRRINPKHVSLQRPIVLSVLSVIVAPAVPLSIGLVVLTTMSGGLPVLKYVGLSTPVAQVVFLGVSYFLLSSLDNYLQHQSHIAWTRVANTVELDLKKHMVSHIHTLDMSYLNNKGTSELLGVLSEDVEQVKGFVQYVPDSLIKKSVGLVAAGGILCVLSPMSLLLILLPVPFIYALTRNKRREYTRHHRALAQQQDEYCQILVNTLNSFADIKSYTAQEHEIRQLEDLNRRYMSLLNTAIEERAYIRSVTQLGICVGVGTSYTYSAIQVLNKTVPVNTIIFQSALAPLVVETTEGLDIEYNRYEKALAATKRMDAVLSVKSDINHGDTRIAEQSIAGEIVFDGVSFGYLSGMNVLHDIHCTIPAKSTVAFVGTSGSGKTTLTQLILRLYDISSGAIRLDGMDIRSLNVNDLRRSVAVVNQDAFLNQQTVADNIAYGKPDATRQEVIEVAKKAKVYDAIRALPQGFDTPINDNSVALSVGERQRITIARALLKNAPVLILDEATSSLDNQTEADIQKTLSIVEDVTTTIIIAHKLQSIAHCDTIFLMDEGRIVEQGTHEELMAHGGSYKKLWALQSQ